MSSTWALFVTSGCTDSVPHNCMIADRSLSNSMDATLGALNRGLEQADVIISTGGTSMGESDLLKPLIERHISGGKVRFGRVAMKPGKVSAPCLLWPRSARSLALLAAHDICDGLGPRSDRSCPVCAARESRLGARMLLRFCDARAAKAVRSPWRLQSRESHGRDPERDASRPAARIPPCHHHRRTGGKAPGVEHRKSAEQVSH